jgi:hypothetical protein
MEVAMPFGSLWLPVLVSAVVVFVLSSIAHMALKHHKADYKRLPSEDAVAAALRPIPPRGLYMLPYCEHSSAMKDPKFMKRYEEGPNALVTVLPNGAPQMGKLLLLWFGLCLLVSFVAAYIARHTLQPGEEGMTVMQITGAVAFTGYGIGPIQDAIWKGIPWSNSLRGIADAVVYAVATGFVFRLLWPAP